MEKNILHVGKGRRNELERYRRIRVTLHAPLGPVVWHEMLSQRCLSGGCENMS